MAIVQSTETINGTEVQIFIEFSDEAARQLDRRSEDMEDPDRILGMGWLAAKTKGLIAQAMYQVQATSMEVVNSIENMADHIKPDEIEVQLGVKLDTAAGVPAIAHIAQEGQIQVTLKWKLEKKTKIAKSTPSSAESE